jgi:D-arabinose 1-dehydrogenase-like Zn-dependent alcohol dehydrogenase
MLESLILSRFCTSCPYNSRLIENRSTHSGVCHSDLGVMTCSWKGLPFPTPEGQVGGHEGVGNIVKLGAGSEAQGVKVGDRVGIKWMAGICGNCRMYIPFSHSSASQTLQE